MPFFLNKITVQDYRKYLKTLELKGLIGLNQKYADPLEKLFDKREKTELSLAALKETRTQYQNQLQSLLGIEPEVIDAEKRRVAALESLDKSSGAEKYIQESQLKMSPLLQYNSEIRSQKIGISETTVQITAGEQILNTINANIALSLQELRILNTFIDEKRMQEVDQQPPEHSPPV